MYENAAVFSDVTIHYGGWCGREPLWSQESGLGDQDIFVATRRPELT